MEQQENSMRFIEPLIHTMVWVIFFGFPLLMITNEGPEIDWVRILHHSIVPLFFCIVFYFNYFILIPRILFRNRIWIWCSVNLAVVLLLSILMQILHLGLIPPRPIYELPRFKLNPGILFFFRDFFSLILVIGVAVSVSLGHSWRKAEIARKEAERLRIEAEQGRTDAELKNLRNQLNPHFLLNTLNNIYALIAFDPDKAQTAVSELGRLLRYVLYDNRHEKISLGSEVSFIKDYIALMKIRLSPDVSLETEIAIPEESTTEISPMLFISLIENAFKHGISPSGRSYIRIRLSENEDEIRCDIVNSFHPKSSSDKSGSGIGLESLSKRLEMLYPGKYEWIYGPDPSGTEYRSLLILKKQP